MDYAEFTDWMFSLERFGIKLGLENITEFLSRIGDPHKGLRSVHVAGTNGKGSVCAFLQRIMMAHGMTAGLYTSPHLVDFRERVKIGDEEIPEKDVLRIGLKLKAIADEMAAEDREQQLTFFEFTTALAFEHFRERKPDIVVAEVGMGGRLDATNVLTPEVSVITRIGLEHTNYLGTAIQDIAREKAGIIKPGIPVVTCERNPDSLSVIAGVCRKKESRLIRIDEDFYVSKVEESLTGTEFEYSGWKTSRMRTKLLGSYQAYNAATALASAELLHDRGIHIPIAEMKKGILETEWPGRLDVASRDPLLILDGSHNPDGITTTVRVLSDLGIQPLTFVLGCMDDKDAVGIVRAIAPIAARIIVTQARYKRALPAAKLGEIVRREYHGPAEVIESSEKAFETGLASKAGKGTCIIGSLYLVGEAIPWWGVRKGVHGASHKL